MQRKHIKFKLYRLSKMIPIFCILALLGIIILPNGRAYATPSASLSVATEDLSGMVAPGEIGYLSSNVTYSTTDTVDYTLQATYANGYDALKLDSSNSGSSSDVSIPGVGTSGKTGTSMQSTNTDAWGFSWTTSTNTDYDNLTYYTMPNFGTAGTSLSTGRLEAGSGSNGSISSTTKKIVFAAKFSDANQATGHYKTKVLLSLIATPNILTTYSITYNLNGGTGGPSNYTESLYDTTKVYTIPTTTPTKAGYEFLGWSTDSAATAADANYAPGKSITLTQGSPGLELYAAWKSSIFDGITTMQQMTTDICNNAAVGDTTILKDTRGGGYSNSDIENSYVVKKLSDGNCWMAQNLKLNLGTVVGTFSSNDTDLSSGTTWPSSTALTTLNSAWKNDNSAPYYNNDPAKLSGAVANQEEYGYYYNWHAATAGTSLSGNKNATGSICPKGWQLPTTVLFNNLIKGETSSEAWKVNYIDNSIGITMATNGALLNGGFFPAAGSVSSGKINNIGTIGRYWTNGVANMYEGAEYSHYLDLKSSSFYAYGAIDRYYGYSVRCVAPAS